MWCCLGMYRPGAGQSRDAAGMAPRSHNPPGVVSVTLLLTGIYLPNTRASYSVCTISAQVADGTPGSRAQSCRTSSVASINGIRRSGGGVSCGQRDARERKGRDRPIVLPRGPGGHVDEGSARVRVRSTHSLVRVHARRAAAGPLQSMDAQYRVRCRFGDGAGDSGPSLKPQSLAP